MLTQFEAEHDDTDDDNQQVDIMQPEDPYGGPLGQDPYDIYNDSLLICFNYCNVITILIYKILEFDIYKNLSVVHRIWLKLTFIYLELWYNLWLQT